MKKLALVFGAILLGVAGFLSISAARYQETIRPNTVVGVVEVGGLTPEEAARKLRVWWEKERRNKIELKSEKVSGLEPVTPNTLGVTLDDEASIAELPRQEFADDLHNKVTGEVVEPETFEVKFKPNGQRPTQLIAMVKAACGEPKPAAVKFEKGTIFRTKETTLYQVDEDNLYEAALGAIKAGEPLELPLKEAPKQVPDEELAKIHEVVSDYSTTFNSRMTTRCANIKLASSKINGLILMPGQKFSFNDTVGRRTVEAGFQLAGVYKNGRHDTGIGGGICQVSTTLYNAALFANLDIVRRSNHSMPVPYVPVGRDATVDYGNLDLVIENTMDSPIALISRYQPGRLDFKVLGTKQPGITVRVYQGPAKSLPVRERRVVDPTLPKGKTKVVENGSGGWSLLTYRNVFQNGVLVKKQTLGRSYYVGGIRIIAVGTKETAPAGAFAPQGGVGVAPGAGATSTGLAGTAYRQQ